MMGRRDPRDDGTVPICYGRIGQAERETRQETAGEETMGSIILDRVRSNADLTLPLATPD